jgi:hypothetical protein
MTASSDGLAMKECTTCREWKAAEEFSPHARGLLGRASKCRECCAAYRRRKYDTDPIYRSRSKRSTDARTTALERLSDLYPDVFARLLDEERAKVGLEPSERPRSKARAYAS